MVADSATPPARSLPIAWLIHATVSSIWRHGRALVYAIALPAAVVLAGNLASAALAPEAPMIAFGIRLVSMLAFPLFAVRWHRLVLRGEPVVGFLPTLEPAIWHYSRWAVAAFMIPATFALPR